MRRSVATSLIMELANNANPRGINQYTKGGGEGETKHIDAHRSMMEGIAQHEYNASPELAKKLTDSYIKENKHQGDHEMLHMTDEDRADDFHAHMGGIYQDNPGMFGQFHEEKGKH